MPPSQSLNKMKKNQIVNYDSNRSKKPQEPKQLEMVGLLAGVNDTVPEVNQTQGSDRGLQVSKQYQAIEDNHSDASSEGSEENENIIFFVSSNDVGSKFLACTLDDSPLSDHSYRDMSFYRDTKGRLVGNFYIHSIIKQKSESVLAFKVETASSLIPLQIQPNRGFLKAGEKHMITIIWPDRYP